MLNVVVYEDNEDFMKRNIGCVNKAFGNCDIDYRILKYSGYTTDLEHLIYQKDIKRIYILDIEVGKVSGLEVASKIREEDDESIIIFSTAHDKYRNDVFYSRLMALDFVCKDSGYDKRLIDDLVASLKILYRQNTFVYSYNHVLYRLPCSSIYYIEKEPLIKRCVIYTSNGKFYISKSINWIESVLKYGFMRTHQSCIVNLNNIKNVDFGSNVITFTNGKSITLLAAQKRKEVAARVANGK